MPQCAYGAQAFGTPPSVLTKIRSTAAAATQLASAGRCLTTVLAITMYGKDPAISIRKDLFKEWFFLWKKKPDLRPRIEHTWQCALEEYDSGAVSHAWHRVRGFAGAVIQALRDIGWQPKTPTHWISPGNDHWHFDDDCPSFLGLLTDIVDSIWSELWQHASEGTHGSGLSEGADLTIVHKHAASLRKHSNNGCACMLERAAANGIWTRQRRTQAGYLVDPLCQRCLNGPDTCFHRIWQCTANCIDNQEFSKSQHLVSRAHVETRC